MDKKRTSNSVEEEAGVLKSGYVTASFSPSKTKKMYYAVLGHRALELHESEKKSQRKNRHPRHLIDLSTCFNINRHFDGRLKYCVAIMTPDETLVLRAETDVLSDEWYDMLMSAVIPARALHLGRPVLANEFFECAWDVTMVEHPKFRKSVKSSEKLVNLCTKDPSLLGPHRLCFYHHTIILCRRGIEPAPSDALSQSGIPPFRVTDFVEFPRQYMASFGSQERYFFMVMGRSSPSGSGELWALCDCEEVAADVHNKLNKIIEEECEKKKKMPNGPLLHLTSTYHRDRLHTHSGIRRTGTTASRKLTPDELSLKERRAQLRGYKWAADLIQERTQEDTLSSNVPSFLWFDSTTARGKCLRNSGSRQNSLIKKVDRMRSFETKISLPSLSIVDRIGSGKNNKGFPGELSFESSEWKNLSRGHSSFASSSATEETEDRHVFSLYLSGGTLRIDLEEVTNPVETSVERQIKATIERTHPFILKQSMPHLESRKVISITSGHPECDNRANEISCSVAGSTSANNDFLQTTPGETSEDAFGDNLEYAPMEMNSWSSGSASHLGLLGGEPQFNFEEVRSYVSDSSDSCYSSIAANGAPRAYSFGASHIIHQQPRRSGRKLMHPEHPENGSPAPDSLRNSSTLPQSEDIHHSNKPSPSTCASQEDARKRAFSLGSSKSWFQKPFRKLSRDFMTRAHRLSNTSQASSTSSTGLSLIHSPNSPFLPSTPQAFIAVDPCPVSRVRSGSIGSGLSTPCSKRHVSNDTTGDHVPVDFGGGGLSLGKSASGSLHSVDSPSRSRTSSFGCGQRCYGLRDTSDIIVHTTDAETEYTSAIPSRCTYERCREQLNSSLCEFDEADDYVIRDPANASDFHISSPRISHDGQLCGNNYSDSRSSQIFETIQESLSGRSSPAKDSESIGSHEEQEVCDKTDRKSQNNRFIGKKVCKEDGGGADNEREQKKILSSDPDLEFVPVDVSFHFMSIK
ncbi:unnamed protein product [Cercopithifilaria johnstoni]|uniref:PH domain-containing protein n=1 Tax=Cercopithifilaria johnstoni TaxID=2874296 RepID=A0A8J2Q1E4_9BILA|nr:unnamed protein product [Cercopithifilaria johnstoni]